MKNDNQKIWTTALRSDMYEQGQERLVTVVMGDETGDTVVRHCCLGVACDQYGLTRDEEQFIVSRDAGGSYYDVTLPPEVSNWLGVTDEDPAFDLQDYRDPRGNRYGITCASANDTLNMSFEQIADMVDYFGLVDDDGN